jgi:hypothetical protein
MVFGSFPSSSSTARPQQRHGRNILRRNGSPPTTTTARKKTLTALVGGTLSLMLVIYLICVIAVTLIGWQHVLGGGGNSTARSYDPISRDTIQQRWDGLKRERGLKDIEPREKKMSKKNKDIFKQHQITAPLNIGVKPEVLIQHHDPTHSVTASKNDIPLHQHPNPDHVLTAYLEPLNFDEWDVLPLPIRKTAQRDQLQKITYSRVNSCRKLTQQWPVDDSPVDTDSFLPWIHDVFPTADGKFIQIIAQNKRRCKKAYFGPTTTAGGVISARECEKCHHQR